MRSTILSVVWLAGVLLPASALQPPRTSPTPSVTVGSWVRVVHTCAFAPTGEILCSPDTQSISRHVVRGTVAHLDSTALSLVVTGGLDPTARDAVVFPVAAIQRLEVDRRVTGASGRLPAQLLLGGLGSLVGGAALCLVGASGGDTGLDPDSPGLGGCLVGGAVGLGLGSSVGVYLGGRVGKGSGSYPLTLAGSAAGVAVFFLVASASLDQDYAPFYIALATLPTGGGIIAYSASARHRDWERVPLDRLRIRVAPTWNGGPGLTVRVGF